jgi:cytidine deaminase
MIMDHKELIQETIKALETSHKRHPPKLKFASAVLTKKGNVYSASSYWSDTASLTLHAEQSALVHAACHGERDILAVSCVSTEDDSGEEKCHPCGMCKQLIWENSLDSGIDVEVIMANRKGEYTVKKISELVSHPWPVK